MYYVRKKVELKSINAADEEMKYILVKGEWENKLKTFSSCE